MCGIIGVTKKDHAIGRFSEAQRSISHRGPDHTGTFEDEHIAISHLLLAIRGDIGESVQPVFRTGSPWVLAFNGQLYNTASMRTKLKSVPATSVDTVLLYALIEQYGWHFIEHIHGMFAIAIYNREEKELRLYRDQSGQKNLYYCEHGGRFHFASEMKALLEMSAVPRRIDGNALAVAASLGYIPGSLTLVAGIRKVQPSEEITFDLATDTLTSRLFVSTGDEEYSHLGPQEAVAQTIADHLQSKRHISMNLSGGLDSSLIFHEAVRHGTALHAFSTRFDISAASYNDDADLAERLAREYGQEFTPINITKGSYLRHFIESYKAIEEPNYNISVPVYHETAMTEGIRGKGLRVVLSGDGGDELFGGYSTYAKIKRIQRFKHLLSPYGVDLYKWARSGRWVDYRDIPEVFFEFRSFKKHWLAEQPDERSVRTYLKESADPLLHAYRAHEGDDVQSLMLIDRYFWLASENFIRSDKLYMSQSMEMRCPLSYTPLRTYMDKRLTSNDYTSAQLNKVFLRNLYAEKLPSYITKRKDKTGWRAPVQVWYDASFKKLFLDILSSVEDRDYVDWKRLKREVEETDAWPGKTIHLYLSLAILIQEWGLA